MPSSACSVRVVLSSSVAIIALLAGLPATAADADGATIVDPVTVTATRTEKAVDEVPATVSVITDAEIADGLVTDIKDLVRYEPGVTVRSSPSRFTAALGATGRDGNSGFNIRGLEGNRVLIQVDGIRTPDGFSFGAQTTGRGDYGDLDMIKSVEILRGPGSALYGSDGVAGVVSFVTKDPRDFLSGDNSFGVQARAGYASADKSTGGGLVIAGRSGALSGMLSYSRRDGSETQTRGETNAANVTRTTANPQDITQASWLGKLVYEPSEASRFRLTFEQFNREIATEVLSARAVPPLGASSTLDLDALDTTERGRVSLDYRYRGEGLFETVTLATWLQDAETVQYSAEDRNTSADRTRRNTFDNRVAGLSAEVVSRVTLGGGEHLFVWGGDVSSTRQEGVRDGTIPPTGEVFPTRAFPNTDYVLAGLFVQDEIALLGGKLILYPALRYDYYSLDPEADALLTTLVPASQSGSHISPKIGAVWAVDDHWSLFANYAQGFKAPAPSQVNNAFANLAFGYVSIPNADLKPETSETIEGGVRWRNDKASASVTVFSGRYDDFIDQVQVGGSFTPLDPALYQYVNLGSVKISGAEARARIDFGGGISGLASASYATGDATTGGTTRPLDSIEPIKVVAGLSYAQPDGRFGGQLIATRSAGKDRSDVGGVCTPSCFTPPDFTIIDATAWWRVTDNAVLRVGAFNLTDQKYWWWSDVRGVSSTSATRDAYTQPGRYFGVSLTLRY